MRRARRAWRVLSVLALATLAPPACSSKPPKLAKGPPPRSVPPRPPLKRGAITMHGLTAVHSRALGPTTARRIEGGNVRASVSAWITAAAGTSRRLLLQALDERGAPTGRVLALADVPLATSHFLARPSGGPFGGFVLAWTSLTDRGKALTALATRDDGMPRGRPVEVVRTDDDVVWADAVPTKEGALLLWAEENREGEASIVAALTGADGKVRGTPTRVARGVTNWQVTATPEGAALVIARAVDRPERKKKTEKTEPHEGRSTDTRGDKELTLLRLDATGAPAGPPTVIASRTQVWGDVETAHTTDGALVVAWTDRTGDDLLVRAALVRGREEVRAQKLVEARTGARLLALTAGPAGIAIAFDAPRGREPVRLVHVSRVGVTAGGLVLEGRPTSLHVQGGAHPELAPTPSGFAVLAPMAACSPEPVEKGEPCRPTLAPTMVRLDARVVAVQTEVIALGDGVATAAWGLSCAREACEALASNAETPSHVSTLTVTPRENLPPPPPAAATPEDAPRITEQRGVLSGESVISLRSARFADGLVVATLGTPHAAGKRGGAQLSTRIVNPDGTSTPPIVLSTRAIPVGGVAIAAADEKAGGGAVAWVAIENGDPEVHVTRLDKRGKRTNDIQLTTTRGDASDVAIAWAAGGFVVAWVDGRDGNGEVYVTRLSSQLERTAREERLTKAPGDASDLVALANGANVWLAWSDPRENPRDGRGDIFVTAVRARDAKRAIDETRIVSTAAHSRTPRLVPSGDGVRVAWIEEAPSGAASPSAAGYGAMHVAVDGSGKPTGAPRRLPVAGEGAATAVALEPTNAGLRAVIARAERDRVVLDGARVEGESERAHALLPLLGPPSMDVVLHLHDGALFFSDDGPDTADKRAVRAVIDWRR